MLTIFKIFVLLLMQQGLTAKNGTPTPIDTGSLWQWSLPVQTTLCVEADKDLMNQVIFMCQHTSLEYISRDLPARLPNETKARLVYTGLPREGQEAITRELLVSLAGRVRIEWREDSQ